MVEFSSWEDYKKFLEKYGKCTCFNCKGYIPDKKDFKGRFVCMKTLSPIRMDLLSVCIEWEDSDGHTLKDFEDCYPYRFSVKTARKLDEMTDKLSFREVEEIINECEGTD